MTHFIHHQPLIMLEDVSKSYGDDYLDFSQLILKHISLSIMPGEFVIIYGPSGSGKSTLLNIIAGLERPTAGKILIKSHDLYEYDEDDLARYHRRKMGMVFQSFNLIKSLNVWENVALPQTADGVAYARRKDQTKRMLAMFGLDKYMYRSPNELSGGEQQRVAIARALISNPLLLLVDEPTGNLDSHSADEVMRLFHGLHEEAKHTILLVTHNPEYLLYASRVVHMEDGEIKKQEMRDAPPVVAPALSLERYNQLRQFRLENEGAPALPLEIPAPPLPDLGFLMKAKVPPETVFSPTALAEPLPGARLINVAQTVPDRVIETEVKEGS